MQIPNSQAELQKLLDQAKKLTPYQPNEEVNQFFSDLYVMSTNSNDDLNPQLLESLELKQLHKICSEAEYQMELYRANHLLKAENTASELEKFPYRNNYLDLTKLEYYAISSQLEKCEKVLFVGSGPLPLTAIILAQKYGVHCILVDRDEKAIAISEKIVKKLWLQSQIEILHSDFLNFLSKERFDGAILASLLFEGNQHDELILEHLSKQINFDIAVMRSAEGKRQLLYQHVSTELIKKYLNLQVSIHPHNHIVNSLLLCTNKK